MNTKYGELMPLSLLTGLDLSLLGEFLIASDEVGEYHTTHSESDSQGETRASSIPIWIAGAMAVCALCLVPFIV